MAEQNSTPASIWSNFTGSKPPEKTVEASSVPLTAAAMAAQEVEGRIPLSQRESATAWKNFRDHKAKALDSSLSAATNVTEWPTPAAPSSTLSYGQGKGDKENENQEGGHTIGNWLRGAQDAASVTSDDLDEEPEVSAEDPTLFARPPAEEGRELFDWNTDLWTRGERGVPREKKTETDSRRSSTRGGYRTRSRGTGRLWSSSRGHETGESSDVSYVARDSSFTPRGGMRILTRDGSIRGVESSQAESSVLSDSAKHQQETSESEEE